MLDVAIKTNLPLRLLFVLPECALINNTSLYLMCGLSCSMVTCLTSYRCSAVTLVCQIKQLKMVDVHKFKLRGIIRPDRRSIDFLLPKSIRVSCSYRCMYNIREYGFHVCSHVYMNLTIEELSYAKAFGYPFTKALTRKIYFRTHVWLA